MSADAPDAPRRMRLAGLHHVTLIASDLEATTAFYRDVLGLRLVREGVNEDDPGTRHLWFGDEDGAPGTLVTFLDYPDLPEGSVGRGSTHHVAFSVSSREELVAWRGWLAEQGVATSEVLSRAGQHSVYLRDPDGHILELTAA